jgi:predicted nicotinamide N-methyase
MSLPFSLHKETFNGISLLVPDPAEVKEWYTRSLREGDNPAFPYWTKVWSSALGMVEYLSRNSNLVRDKDVLEVGAGLGLPSMYTAQFAKSVLVTDYLPEAIELLELNTSDLKNVSAQLLDWRSLPSSLKPEVLLLSDVNYEPEAFSDLLKMIKHFISLGTHIIISTPQRIMTREFVELVEDWVVRQEVVEVQEKEVVVVELFTENKLWY